MGTLRAGLVAASLAVLSQLPARAAPDSYPDIDGFLKSVFAGQVAEPRVLFVDARLRRQIEAMLDHGFPQLRLRHWRHGETTAWVFDEIGKTEPITIGIAIEAGRVASVRVLEFRESRGGEIRFPFFTDQFVGAGLTAEGRVDRPIDGITGATLSVAAVDKVVRLALICDAWQNTGAD